MRRNVHTVVMCLNPVPYAPSAQTASSRRRTRESRVKNVKCVVPSGNTAAVRRPVGLKTLRGSWSPKGNSTAN